LELDSSVALISTVKFMPLYYSSDLGATPPLKNTNRRNLMLLYVKIGAFGVQQKL